MRENVFVGFATRCHSCTPPDTKFAVGPSSDLFNSVRRRWQSTHLPEVEFKNGRKEIMYPERFTADIPSVGSCFRSQVQHASTRASQSSGCAVQHVGRHASAKGSLCLSCRDADVKRLHFGASRTCCPMLPQLRSTS